MRGSGRLIRLLAGARPSAAGVWAAEGPAGSLVAGSHPRLRLAQGFQAVRPPCSRQLRAQSSAADPGPSNDQLVDQAIKEILSERPSEAVVQHAADVALEEATQGEAAVTGIEPPTPATDLPLPADGGAPPAASQAAPASASQAATAAAAGEVAGAAAATAPGLGAGTAAAAVAEQPTDAAGQPDPLTSSNPALQQYLTAWGACSAKLSSHDFYETREHKLDSVSM